MNSLSAWIRNRLGGGRPDEAKSFRENQACERAFDHIDRGTCSVPLDQIVGSVGRYHDFDSQFKLKSHVPPDRLISVKQKTTEKQLAPNDPLWTDIVVMDAAGKQTNGLPTGDGYFELILPPALLKDQPRSITLEWIDFYR